MTIDDDRELEQWSSDWQSASEREYSTEAIRLYAQGRNRFMWTWMIVELTIAGIALPVIAYLGWMAQDVVESYAMLLLAFVTITAAGVGWWNWRGSLLASAKSTAEFVTVSTERLRRMRQAWRIGWIVLAAQVMVFSVWIWSRLYAAEAAPTVASERFAWGWLLFVSLTAVAFLLWMDGRIRRDAEKFEALKRELELPNDNPTSPGRRPPGSGPASARGLRARGRSKHRAVPR